MTLNISAPFNLGHPDNTGLQFAMLNSPAYTGGGAWPDAVGRIAGATAQLGGSSGTGAITWQGNQPCSSNGGYWRVPWTDFSGNGTIVWGGTPSVSGTDSSIRGFWGQGTSGNPGFTCRVLNGGTWSIGLGIGGTDYRLSLSATPTNWIQGAANRYAYSWTVGGNANFYANGALVGSYTGSLPNNTLTNPMFFGRQSTGNSQPYLGLLGEFRYYRGSVWDLNIHRRDYEWSLTPQRDPRFCYITSRFWSIPTSVGITSYPPAFQTSFWGIA